MQIRVFRSISDAKINLTKDRNPTALGHLLEKSNAAYRVHLCMHMRILINFVEQNYSTSNAHRNLLLLLAIKIEKAVSRLCIIFNSLQRFFHTEQFSELRTSKFGGKDYFFAPKVWREDFSGCKFGFAFLQTCFRQGCQIFLGT
jgi:hypothetical protein